MSLPLLSGWRVSPRVRTASCVFCFVFEELCTYAVRYFCFTADVCALHRGRGAVVSGGFVTCDASFP